MWCSECGATTRVVETRASHKPVGAWRRIALLSVTIRDAVRIETNREVRGYGSENLLPIILRRRRCSNGHQTLTFEVESRDLLAALGESPEEIERRERG